jgi:hypothetical protein
MLYSDCVQVANPLSGTKHKLFTVYMTLGKKQMINFFNVIFCSNVCLTSTPGTSFSYMPYRILLFLIIFPLPYPIAFPIEFSYFGLGKNESWHANHLAMYRNYRYLECLTLKNSCMYSIENY